MQKMQTGGVSYKEEYTEETAFKYFLENCRVELLTNESRYGLIVKCDLFDTIDSPYISSTGREIDSIIVKLVLITQTTEEDYKYLEMQNSNNEKKNTVIEADFNKEIRIQNDITLMTIKDPICPFIITTGKENADNTPILNLLIKKSTTEVKELLLLLKRDFNYPRKLGFIAMEIINGKALNFILFRRYYQNLTRFQYFYLAYLGYIHGDLHQSNVIIDFDKGDGDKNGKCLLIDFGRTKIMTPEKLKTFRFFFEMLLDKTKEDELKDYQIPRTAIEKQEDYKNKTKTKKNTIFGKIQNILRGNKTKTQEEKEMNKKRIKMFQHIIKNILGYSNFYSYKWILQINEKDMVEMMNIYEKNKNSVLQHYERRKQISAAIPSYQLKNKYVYRSSSSTMKKTPAKQQTTKVVFSAYLPKTPKKSIKNKSNDKSKLITAVGIEANNVKKSTE